jgi:hypothetical protein
MVLWRNLVSHPTQLEEGRGQNGNFYVYIIVRNFISYVFHSFYLYYACDTSEKVLYHIICPRTLGYVRIK